MSDLAELAAERERLEGEVAKVTRRLIAAVADRVEAAGEGERVNIRALTREAKVSPQTVYTELGRRQETRDALSSNGGAPPAAPHDDDRAAALEPTVQLTDAQRRVLRLVANDRYLSGGDWVAFDSLKRKGLAVDDRDTDKGRQLTRAGRELLERGGAS